MRTRSIFLVAAVVSAGVTVVVAPQAAVAAAGPHISSIAPARISTVGRQRVEITGSGLAGATSVRFGTRRTTQGLHLQQPGVLAVTAPVQSAGRVAVRVTSDGHTSNAGVVTYVRPPVQQYGVTAMRGAASRLTCPTAGFCVGSYTAPMVRAPVVEVLRDGTWQTETVPVPADTDPDQYFSTVLNDLSCASATFCVGVGQYIKQGATLPSPWVATMTGTTWTAQATDPPAGTAHGATAELKVVDCPATGACVAAGYTYDEESGYTSYVQDIGAAVGDPVVLPSPRHTELDLGVPSDIDCPVSTSWCAVTVDNALAFGGDGTWTTLAAATPAGLPPSTVPVIHALDCPTVGRCFASGYYYDDRGAGPSAVALIDHLYDGTLHAQTIASAPDAGPGHLESDLASIDCPAPGTCVEVGTYGTVRGTGSPATYRGLIVRQAPGSSGRVAAPLPAGFAGAQLHLDDVSCASTTRCWAVGVAFTSNPVLERFAGGVWSARAGERPGNEPPYYVTDGGSSVSCPAAAPAACVATTPLISVEADLFLGYIYTSTQS